MDIDQIKKTCADLAAKQQQLAAQIEQAKSALNQVIGAQIAYQDILAKMEKQNGDEAQEKAA